MKTLLFFGSIALVAALTSCPGLQEIPTTTRTIGIGVSVSPQYLNLKANSSVVLTVKLEHPEQPHPAMMIRFVNLPGGLQANSITIPSGAHQAQLELRTGANFQADPNTPIAIQALNETTSTPTEQISDLPNDGSNIQAVFSSTKPTNANLKPFKAQVGYANFQGSLCQIMASDQKRNLQICLTAPFKLGKTYQLVDAKHFGKPGTALITYFEQPETTSDLVTNTEAHFWDSSAGTLTLGQISSSLLEFQTSATMEVAGDFEHNTATHGFQLEVTGHIENVMNLKL